MARAFLRSILAVASLAVLISSARGDQAGFANSGGTLSGGTPVANPPGTLTINSGTLTFASSDASVAINATFTSSSSVTSCSGGGRGGRVTCSVTFRGTFSGTLSSAGVTQAINGSTYQVSRSGAVISGTTGYNSAYTPFYFSNTGQILRSDDLDGANLISYGTQGSDVGQFYGAYGIAVDAAGRIYVADTYNARIVRIDDMAGTNWTSFGEYGSGIGQFNNLQGISIDPAGRIYVMDTGNNRLVRMDDLYGTNWIETSGTGSDVGQFAQYVAAPAFDASGRIYIADAGNRRVVRMDDMSATNWTTLSQSPVIGMYIYSFASPVGVAVDAAGKIYVADAYVPSVVRVDDMSGTNWTSIRLGAGATPHSIAVDASGMVLVGGGGAQIVDSMAGTLSSASGLTEFYGPYYVFGATPVAVPNPRPSAIKFSPASLTFSQDVGTTSSQTITLTNFGAAQLNLFNLSASAGFAETNNCPSILTPGSSCSVSVSFTPADFSTVTGSLTVNDDSGNLGSTQAVPLSGTGTAPAPPPPPPCPGECDD